MLEHPFLAAAIARLPIGDASAAPWCVTAATDGYHIVVNLDFLAGLTDDEALFVLAHEVLHVVFGHPDRRDGRDTTTWNCATDFAVNQVLVDMRFAMPSSGLLDWAFAGMPAEAIYDALWRKEHGRGRGLSADRFWSGAWCQQTDPGSHLAGDLGSGDMPTSLERGRMRQGLVQAMREHVHGRAAGAMTEEIRAAGRRSVPWEDLLAAFITGIRQSDYRSYPFNRKHVYRGVYLPSVGAPGPRRLVVAIDTSGSIDASTASRLLGEVDALRAATECDLTVLQCDASVNHVATFDAWESSVLPVDGTGFQLQGRGGTDFRPVFDWVEKDVEEGALPPDAVIYLTDGYGPFPAAVPEWPVVWIVTTNGAHADQFPFGRVIRLTRGRSDG